MNKPAEIGHNQPPKSLFEEAEDALATLHIEASNWLDGEPIENQAQADTIGTLINDIRAARKDADSARKVEAAPFDAGKREVQARYNPLLDSADLMTTGCKKLLTPFLARVEAEKRAIAEAERKRADDARRVAEDAIRAAAATDLAAREEAEAKLREAKDAEAVAKRAESDKAAGRGGGRAITLRTFYEPEITDMTLVARYYWKADRTEVEAFFTDLVGHHVRAGDRNIPGVTVHERQVAQ